MSVAANRYATAIIDVLKLEQADHGLRQLQQFAAFLKEEPSARRFLENPAMAGDRRKKLLTEISSALGFDRRVANFIHILTDRNRLPILDEIITEYQRLMDKRLGIVRARVTASRVLDAPQQQELVRKLEQITGKQVRMEVVVDAALIGGLIAQVGSTVYDGSIRRQLQAIRAHLVGE
jgi:F-type H+-transporting ATPase subunit delta